MSNPQITEAVENFAALMLPLSEKELEHDWSWKDHDEEGIRFAFFVTFQDLRQLAVTMSTLRSKPTTAQHILGYYHAAYMDLQAALLGLFREDSEKVPSEGEWSVRDTYAHILGGNIGFTAVVRYALEGHRAGNWKLEKMSEVDADRLVKMTDEEYEELIGSSLKSMMAFHHDIHAEIIEDFSMITDDELKLPSTFWEETRFPIRHRLHRFEAHLIQHTVQIDKTLVTIGKGPSESKQLLWNEPKKSKALRKASVPPYASSAE